MIHPGNARKVAPSGGTVIAALRSVGPERRSRLARTFLTAAIVVAASTDDSTLARQDTEPRVIQITARRFAFEPSEVTVGQGDRVRFLVKSGDGRHGFAIRRFRIEEEIPRGDEVIVIDFVASAAGRFPILCSEFCGDGHEDMKAVLVVNAREAQP